MFGLGPFEIIVVGAIAVMLYGKRLPEVGRSAGKVLGDLRRQWSSLAAELDVAAHIDEGRSRASSSRPGFRGDDGDTALVAGPRFDAPADPPA